MEAAAITTLLSNDIHDREQRQPQLLILPAFSSHEETLLMNYGVKNWPKYQSKFTTTSEYILLNQTGSGVGIDEVRELSQQLSFSSKPGTRRLVVIFHAESISLPAQHALLKLLEEPPIGVEIILTCEDANSILSTICSRLLPQYISKNITINQIEYKNAVEKLLADLPTLSLRELIENTELYKENDQTIPFVKVLIDHLHTQLEQSPSEITHQYLATALKHYQILASTNTTSRLVLERLFFSLHELCQTQK